MPKPQTLLPHYAIGHKHKLFLNYKSHWNRRLLKSIFSKIQRRWAFLCHEGDQQIFHPQAKEKTTNSQ